MDSTVCLCEFEAINTTLILIYGNSPSNKQHIAVVLGLGALYPARDVVRAVLAPEDGVTKKILDLGMSYQIRMKSISDPS
jgi:hypothetical protein